MDPSGHQSEEVPLTGSRSEFRTALREEIDAARRNASSSAIPLENGRRIAQVGSSFQYLFDIQNVISLPGDVPGDLVVPGGGQFEVTVVSIEGQAIVVSVPSDLGHFVAHARLQSNLTQLMRKLISRIEEYGDRPNPAGDRIRGVAPVSGEPTTADIHSALNEQQTQAVRSVLGRDTTFIWGPPGTGKTLTIGAIGYELFISDRSLLMVSHTNTAVDQALVHIASAVGSVSPEAIRQGAVIRVGDAVDQRINDQPNLLLETHVRRRSEKLAARRQTLDEERRERETEALELGRQFEIVEWINEAPADLVNMESRLRNLDRFGSERSRCADELAQSRSAVDRLDTVPPPVSEWHATEVRDGVRKVLDELPDLAACGPSDERLQPPSGIVIAMVDATEAADDAVTYLTATISDLDSAESVLEQATSVGALRRRWRRLPSPEDWMPVIDEARANVEEATHQSLATVSDAVDATGDAVHEIGTRQAADRRELVETMQERLRVLADWGLAEKGSGTPGELLVAIAVAIQDATARFSNLSLRLLRIALRDTNDRIGEINRAIGEIDQALREVERLVIAEATVVATTLTRTYLRDSIQSRRFDTVVLDEASMAPIPALWIAAGLADRAIVAVGDPKQLPPIVVSPDKVAQRWLGTDIFVEAGADDTHTAPPHRVDLREQFRMHPQISAIPNALVYDGVLTDGPDTGRDPDEFLAWYDQDWRGQDPVLCVNTARADAWVTSVPRGAGSSRLNFLSATICVDIAHQLLCPKRKPLPGGSGPRILIVCPYRPHAELLNLMLRESGFTEEVRAGTAHSFQGSEADVVILDLVNDEPHWKVAMFIPSFDEATRPLLNVALTRARRRLIVVGDLDYIAKQGKRAFLGGQLIPFLVDRYPVVDALEIANPHLAARTAKGQRVYQGDELEPSGDRIVVTQQHFFSMFASDLAHATQRVVIYSPFLTENRLSQIEARLSAAVERGVAVYVVTKPLSERWKRNTDQYRELEQTLDRWGIAVIHKKGMHEKLVFIDDDIAWVGSLNPLSYSDTQEIMERRRSRAVVAQYAETIRLNDLVGGYTEGSPTCPICNAEMLAAEGRNEPFYWRCTVDHCYTRSIDDPPLVGGKLNCRTCSADVEYGYWGGEPHWRCTENKRHRQRIARTHLRLPKMRSLIPDAEVRVLEEAWGL
jgi:hypothetical protein